MDRLNNMQQWASRQSTSQYGNNPWVRAMMKFMEGFRGNYGSSASGWGGGTSNAGQQAQAPAPKPPAQQAQAPAPKPPAQETSWATPRGGEDPGSSSSVRDNMRYWEVGGDQLRREDEWKKNGPPWKDNPSHGMTILPVLPSGTGPYYHTMPAGEPNNRPQITSMPFQHSGITNLGPENVMRVTSLPGVMGNVYPQWVADYMMSHRPNASGQGQGV